MFWLLVLLLVLLNLGGLGSIILAFGQGEATTGLGNLLMLAALDALGFWLLRQLRER